MIIKNISNKIINVGTTVLMPDATMPANKKMRKNPALMAFEKHNLITFIEEEKDKESVKTAPKSKPETPKPAATPDSAETASTTASTETQK